MQDLFYQLIRVSIGAQDSLTRPPTAKEWQQLYDMAKKQSLVGVCFAGVQKLGFASYDNDDENENLSNNSNLSLLSQSGDIDVYVACGMSAARAYAEKVCGRKCRYDYKNLHWPIYSDSSTGSAQDTEVEMHYRVDVIMDVLKHGRMQKFWDSHTDEILGGRAVLASGHSITCPSLQLNSFYILFHCYRHLFEGGVGLRQVMDYYFVLKAQNELADASASKAETMGLVKDFGMKQFTSAMMWIMQEVFGMSREMLLCDPDESEGRYILRDIMEGENFGHHDERIKDVGSSSRTRYLSICNTECIC